MSNDFVMPAGKWVTVPTPGRMQKLDQQVSELLNGDDGGEWSPEKPIAIGGAGLSLPGDMLTVFSQFTGGVRTGRKHRDGHDPAIRVGSTQWPTFSPSRSRRVLVMPPAVTVLDGSKEFLFDANGQINGSKRVAATAINVALLVPAMRLHNNATLSTVTFRWRITQEPQAIDSEQFFVYRVRRDAAPGTAELLSSLTMSPTASYAGDVAAYWANGSPKAFAVTCDQNNVIDTSTYLYFLGAFIADPSILHSIELEFTGISRQTFE